MEVLKSWIAELIESNDDCGYTAYEYASGDSYYNGGLVKGEYGSGKGLGDGCGNADGTGYGGGWGDRDENEDPEASGAGDELGNGYGCGDLALHLIKTVDGKPVYLINDSDVVILNIRGNIAKCYEFDDGFQKHFFYLVKSKNRISRGKTLKKAVTALKKKTAPNETMEEFLKQFLGRA